MRTKHLFYLLAAALCLFGTTSCKKDFTGKSIRFSAVTRSNAATTKTAYSGVVTEGKERIDWVDGDQIKLAMKNDENANSSHVYAISDITTDGRYSKAGLEPDGGNGLEWGTGTHDFWAAYPSTATFGNHSISGSISDNQTVSFIQKKNDVLLYDTDMSGALMVAGLQTTPSDAGISLDFYPAFTTFDFTVGANDNITITNFEMETEAYEEETSTVVPICGAYSANFNASGSMSHTFSSSSTSQTITVSFDDGAGNDYHPIISTTTSMNFKVFALPLDITGVRIQFHLSNGRTHKLRLKKDDAWLVFSACTKVNISGLLVPGADWYINFEYPREEQWVIHPDIEIGVE